MAQTKLVKALAAVEKITSAIRKTGQELATVQGERGEILDGLAESDAGATLGEKLDAKAVQTQKQRMAGLPLERLGASLAKLQERLPPAMLELAEATAAEAQAEQTALQAEISDRQAEVQAHLDAAAAAAYRAPALYDRAPYFEFLLTVTDREALEARGALETLEVPGGIQRSFRADEAIPYANNLAACLEIARSRTAKAQQAVAQLASGGEARDIVALAEQLAGAREPEPEAEPIAEDEAVRKPA